MNRSRNFFLCRWNCTNQSATSIDSSCHCDHKNQSQQNPLHVTKDIQCLVNQLLLEYEGAYFLCRDQNTLFWITLLMYFMLFERYWEYIMILWNKTSYTCFQWTNYTNSCLINQICVVHLLGMFSSSTIVWAWIK